MEVNQNEIEAQIQKKVCDAFCDVLKIDNVNLDDSLISLGADSIDGMKIYLLLDGYGLTGLDIAILKTPRLIAKKMLENNVANLKDQVKKYTIDSGAPLSEQQLNVYLDMAINKKFEAYLIPAKLTVNKFNMGDVVKALYSLQNIHPILKGYIEIIDNRPFIKIGDPVNVCVVDSLSKNELKKFLTSSFDINKNLARFLIDKKNKNLYCVFHHLIFDGMSGVCLTKDIYKILNKEPIEQDLKFLEACEFSESIKDADIYKEAETFIDLEFESVESISELPKCTYDNKICRQSLSLNINNEKLNNFIKKNSISKNALFTSVFAYTLSRFTNNEKVIFSFLHNGRDRLNALNSVGMFVNTLPIVINCENDRIVNFINKAQNSILKMIEYSFYP